MTNGELLNKTLHDKMKYNRIKIEYDLCYIMLTDVETRMPQHRKKPVRFAAEAVNCV